MKRIFLAAILALAPATALAQAATTSESAGAGRIGPGQVASPVSSAGGDAGSISAITTTPVAGAATGGSTSPGSSASGGSSSGGGSGGGGHGGGIEALCLSASGAVSSVDPDEFGLDCSQ